MEPVEKPEKPWHQLGFVLGEAVLSLISGGVLFIIISRVSGPELLGTYALAFSWLMLFQGVSSFGVPEYLMREVGAYGRDAAPQLFHGMLVGLVSGVIAICLMLAAARTLGYSAYLVQVISVTCLALIPAFLVNACRSAFLALHQMQLTFLAVLVEVTIVMSTSLYLLLSGYGAIALMVTLVVAKVASAVTALTLLYCRALPVRPSFDLDFMMRTASKVFIFGVGNTLGMLTLRINVIMASVWVDITDVGHFAAATKIMEIGLIVPNLFAQLLMTRISYAFNTQGNRDPNRFATWFQILFSLVVPTCVGVWVFSAPILEILFGKGFGNASWILRILMIYLVVEAADAAMSVILKAAQRPRADVSLYAFNPLTNVVLNLILLPILGTLGAAIGRVGGVCVSATLRYFYIAKVLTEMNWFRIALKPALISISVGSICYSLRDIYRPVLLMLLYMAVTAVLLRISSGLTPSAVKDMMRYPPSGE